MARRTIENKDKLVAKAVEYYNAGRGTRSIANTLHLSQATIYNWLVGAGVEMRGRGRPVTVRS